MKVLLFWNKSFQFVVKECLFWADLKYEDHSISETFKYHVFPRAFSACKVKMEVVLIGDLYFGG